MIFSPDLAEKVVTGRKTVTRRPVKSLYGDDVQPCRYEQGRTYAVQPGRGKKAIGHIWIADVELQPLSDALTWDEAKREGFPSPQAFTRYWHELYGGFRPDLGVWRIEFELDSRGTHGEGEK